MKNRYVIQLITFLIFLSFSLQAQSKPPDNLEKIKALPYLNWVKSRKEDSKKSGVTVYDKDRTWEEVSIFNFDEDGRAYLIDMDGKTLHSWSSDKKDWHYAEMDEEGNLYVIVHDSQLMKLNWNSGIIWENKMQFHHDLDRDDKGRVYCISREVMDIPYKAGKIPILNDYIVILDSDGNLQQNISIYGLFGDLVNSKRLEEIAKLSSKLATSGKEIDAYSELGQLCDVFHVNTIEFINRDIKDVASKGDILISIRELNIIAIISLKSPEIVWSWGGNDLKRQHHPSLLNNDNILIFDNGGKREFSRIVELNPITRKIEWEYKSNPPKKFFSGTRGACQRLPNGNTLITESDHGHVFEITRAGEIVWEFWSKIWKKHGKRRALYRMMRISSDVLKKLPFDQRTAEYLKMKGYL